MIIIEDAVVGVEHLLSRITSGVDVADVDDAISNALLALDRALPSLRARHPNLARLFRPTLRPLGAHTLVGGAFSHSSSAREQTWLQFIHTSFAPATLYVQRLGGEVMSVTLPRRSLAVLPAHLGFTIVASEAAILLGELREMPRASAQ